MKRLLTTLLILLISLSSMAQLTQTIRGRVTDKESKTPLPGATIILLNSDPLIGTTSDENGNFRLTGVGIGRQGISVRYIGYKTASFENLIVHSAKEVIIEAELEENVIQTQAVEIKAYSLRDETINRMTAVSARSFSVEETEKYAGSRGDVARMAMNYAGVLAANDQRNDIIIRGNSPSGLLWKLEDVDIPNPNHFAENGTTGGPVGMLNNNLLSNSDFMTGAFPAEYGNALSGVFDLKMRNGNNEKHEFLFQVGFNGFELGAEGPFSKGKKASYLANFRYSTMELMDGLIDFGTTGIPKYKDLSFKLNFPMKKGRISVFALGGDSEIAMLDSKDGNEQDLYTDEGQDLTNRSTMAASGISYTRFSNSRTYYKIMLSGVYQDGGTKIDTLDIANIPHQKYDQQYTEFKTSLTGFVHTKYNSRLSTRMGAGVDRMGFDILSKQYNSEDQGMRSMIDFSKSLNNGVNLFSAYAQATYRFNDRLSVIPGLHFSYFDLNGSAALEPRIGFNWQLTENKKLSFGYGLHSRTQTLSAYFYGTHMDDGSLVETNKELDFTRSHQFVMAYDWLLTSNTRFKAEAYYQNLFNVPVEEQGSSFSMLNTGASWGLGSEDSLVNRGSGYNYGLEFTMERFFSRNIYYLATLSLFQSKYEGSDGVERNTAFNGNYVLNMLVGKEFPINPRSTFFVDFKLSYAGGKCYTPVDLAASQAAGTTKYDETKAFSERFDPFFKADIKVGYRMNGKKLSHEWLFYVENFTNNKNVLLQAYSKSENEVKDLYQLGFFPMAQYRLHF
ncbi:MAG: TonB-dependent receptor [Bacteroidales bacterium]|nr:TonB-dependent receptor [Bacteroidales bacterium]